MKVPVGQIATHAYAPNAEYWPTGQSVHAEAPDDPAILPAPQPEHVPDEPTVGKYWPTTQLKHDVLPAAKEY